MTDNIQPIYPCSSQKCRDAAKLLMDVFETDAFDWAIQEKVAAGQSVAHLHMHVVPRKIGDLPNPGDWYQKLEQNGVTDIDTCEGFRLTEGQLRKLTLRLKTRAANLFTQSKSGNDQVAFKLEMSISLS